MWQAVFFLLGVVSFALFVWIWESITGQRDQEFYRQLEEMKAGEENERLNRELLQTGLPPLSRREIWTKMTWVWKETRGWAIRSRSLAALLCLGLFGVLYLYVWLKTLVAPNSHDLRLLLGGRSVLLLVAQR